LQASIGTASAADLAMMGSQVSAAVRQSEAIEREAGEQIAAITGNVVSASLQQAATASRTAVTSAMDCLRHTPLQFASAEDERAYREREEETRRYIAEQNAKGTPEGNLNAAGATVGQMVDAKAHGAHGPEFDQQWANLVATTEKLREQVRASGGSTKEFDDRLRERVRRILQAKGLSDEQIDAQFTAHHGDPLEVAKTFVTTGNDVGAIEQVAKTAVSADVVGVVAVQTPPPVEGMSEIMANLKLAGITGGQTPELAQQPEHGVTVAVRGTPTVAAKG
jgi:hypothetical protein